MNLNLKNYTYQTTLLFNLNLPASQTQIIQEINTIKFDKTFILDTRASCFYEFYNVVAGLNNTFTISKGTIELGNNINIGAIFYKEIYASDNFIHDSVPFEESINTKLNLIKPKYLSYRINALPPDPTRIVQYIPNSAKFNLSQDKDQFAILNGKFLLNPTIPYGSLCFTSKINEPTLENQLITNQILNWQYGPIILQTPYKNMSIHCSLRFRDNHPFTDSDLDLFGHKVGITELNCNFLNENNQRRLTYFLHELPKDYFINMEYENIGVINILETKCHYYDENGNYIRTANFSVYNNIITFLNEDEIDKYFAIEIFNNFNVGQPNYQEPKRIFLTGRPVEIQLDEGYYNGLDGIKKIFDACINGFKNEFGIDITITLNEVNNLVTISTKSDEIINISFPNYQNSSNLFFGFDTYSIDIDKTITSPNHADLFSKSKFSNIYLIVDQLASSGYLSERNIILNISPSDQFGQRMSYSDITFFKNFMTGTNLNYITVKIVDGDYQPISNKSDIYINFKINCFNRD